MTADDPTTTALSRLIRGEQAAAETYALALTKVGDEPGAADLETIATGHRDALKVLRQEAARHNGHLDLGSGTWGPWSQTVLESAQVFGDAAVLQALKEGEQATVKEYQAALADKDLPLECKEVIQTVLLPRQCEHARTLEALLNSQAVCCT